MFNDLCSVTPVVNIVQTFINEDKLYHAIVDLPKSGNFLGSITTVATHPMFKVLEGRNQSEKKKKKNRFENF